MNIISLWCIVASLYYHITCLLLIVFIKLASIITKYDMVIIIMVSMTSLSCMHLWLSLLYLVYIYRERERVLVQLFDWICYSKYHHHHSSSVIIIDDEKKKKKNGIIVSSLVKKLLLSWNKSLLKSPSSHVLLDNVCFDNDDITKQQDLYYSMMECIVIISLHVLFSWISY